MYKIPEYKATKEQAEMAEKLVASFKAIESNVRDEILNIREQDLAGSGVDLVHELSAKVSKQCKTKKIEKDTLIEFYAASVTAADANLIDNDAHQQNIQKIYRTNSLIAPKNDVDAVAFAISYVRHMDLETSLDVRLLDPAIAAVEKAKDTQQAEEKAQQHAERVRELKARKRDIHEMDEAMLRVEYQLAKNKFIKRSEEGKANEIVIERFDNATRHASTLSDKITKPLIDWDEHLRDLSMIANCDISKLRGKAAINAHVARECVRESLEILNQPKKKQTPSRTVSIEYDLVSRMVEHGPEARVEHVAGILDNIYLHFKEDKIKNASTAYKAAQMFKYQLTIVRDPRALQEGKKQQSNPTLAAFMEEVEQYVAPEKAALRARYLPTPKNQ